MMLRIFIMVALTTSLVAKGIHVLVKHADQRVLAQRRLDKKLPFKLGKVKAVRL